MESLDRSSREEGACGLVHLTLAKLALEGHLEAEVQGKEANQAKPKMREVRDVLCHFQDYDTYARISGTCGRHARDTQGPAALALPQATVHRRQRAAMPQWHEKRRRQGRRPHVSSKRV